MDSTEVLRESDARALDNNQVIANNQIVSHVKGKQVKTKSGGKLKSFTAMGFITAIIVVAAMILNSGTLIPSGFAQRLIEQTDAQYADAVESKKIVFQQLLKNGEITKSTADNLAKSGVEVGYMKDGSFTQGTKTDGELVLKMGDKIITADNFIKEVNASPELYDAFNNATYSRAAYYYDEAADRVFKERIGTTRHNYTEDSNFEEVMDAQMGKGSDIEVNSVSLSEGDDGEDNYNENGSAANSKSDDFVEAVRAKNLAKTAEEAALNSADMMKVADTDVQQKRSSLFYSLIMEPISQMKAGDGNDILNQVMNYLYEEAETEVVNTKTTNLVKTRGSAMDSPSLYAILTGEKVDVEKVEDYSSDRILKTVENKLGGANGGSAIKGTVASTSKDIKSAKGVIGRLLNGVEKAAAAIVDVVKPTVKSSLVNNSYEDIKGINAGELLAKGAVNTGRMLAKESGATAGDAEAATKYARLNSSVVAMDARVDRMNRSPFDITSKNTFLGAIFYNLAITSRKFGGSLIAKTSSLMGATGRAMATLMPGAYADEAEGILTTFGNCETIGDINAVGWAGCDEIATFDTSTLNNPYGDAGFVKFVEENTTLSDGTRTIDEDSILGDFIKFNNERTTPIGVMDGGILEALNGGGSVSLVSDIIEMVKNLLGASESDKRIATGATFVNSSSNPDWQTYKYAQRYVSLARAAAAIKKHAGAEAAIYDNLLFFEGTENPVIAYINKYYDIAKE